MEKVDRTVHIDLIQCPTDVPGHMLDIVVQQHIKIFPDVADLGEGFVPEGLQCGVGVSGLRAIPKKVVAGAKLSTSILVP